MNLSREIVLAAFFCLVCAFSLSQEAQPADKDPLENQRSILQKGMLKISQDESAGLVEVQKNYLEKLKELEKQFQAEGLLDPLLAVKKENERFQTAKEVTDATLARNIPDILSAQTGYRNAVSVVHADAARKLVSLAAQYARSLKDVETDLTRKGDFDLALKMRKEREGVDNRPDMVKARNIVAEADAAAKKEAERIAATRPATPEPGAQPVVKRPVGGIQGQIARKAGEFFKIVLAQNWPATVDFASPEIVKTQGKAAVQGSMMARFSTAKYGATKDLKYEWGTAEVSDDQKTAALPLKILVRKKWIPLDKMPWEQANGEWYIHVASD